ncbi:recombination-associated protein RdgC [Candidatus Methylocalor cossyra]|uniref:Recombination-associated protein RdgC n=1 Tax=Candidatus Methylocalor cossyra TaxID=3108543 RepID=A0ABM9NIS4_9GAMM
MWFKNLALLRFTEPFGVDASALERHLQQRPFRPCGSLELASLGWCPPWGKEGSPLVHSTHGFLLICLQKEEKILPAAVVNEVVAHRATELEDARGRPVRRKERDALRDEVLHELLPRAFSHSRRTYAYLDPKGGWLVVDSASPKRTEELTGVLRQTLGSLPVAPLVTRERPSAVMTRWLADQGVPPDIVLDSECELRSPGEDGGIVRCRRHDLGAPEIQHHLEAGKEASKLAFTWNDRLSLVLDETLAVKRLRFLDLVQEEAAAADTDDPAARFDADFAVMSSELAAFLPRLMDMFGGENSPGKPS